MGATSIEYFGVKYSWTITAISFLLFFAGCHLGPKYEAPIVETPEGWKGEAPVVVFSAFENWWEVFGDEQLDCLMRETIDKNLDIAIALQRVAEARAVAGIAKSDLYPEINLNPVYNNVGELIKLYGVPSGMFPGLKTITRVHQQSYQLPVGMRYEVDLWGKYRGTYEAFAIYAQAEEEALRASILTLTADLASNYFNLRALDMQLSLLASIIEERKELSRLVSARYQTGVVGYTDWMEAEARVSNAEAEYQDTLRQRILFENAIAVLIGKAAPEVEIASIPLDDPSPDIPAGLPSDVLLRRPDIAQAERTMASFHSWIGVAYSTYFPSLALTGTLGYSSPDLSRLLQWASRLWQIGAAIGQILFNGGKNRSEVDLALAKFKETQSAYEKAVLCAFQEVEDALGQAEKQHKQSLALKRSYLAAKETHALSLLRFRKGVASNLEVLEKEEARLEAKRAWMQVLGQRYQSIVQLIKALGGSWEVCEKNNPVYIPEYTGSDSRIGNCQGDARNFSQAKPAPKQINLKSLSMQAGMKFRGYPTQAKPILES